MFYFTDNIVTYYVVNGGSSRSPGLQDLIYRIKALEQVLGCMLEVVHVPGTTLIAQGADDLSRGVWVSPFRTYVPAPRLVPALFAAVRLAPGWEALLRAHTPSLPETPFVPRRWSDEWTASNVLHQCTVWAPPVEMAPQVISGILTLWTEAAGTTSAIIFLPRILQRQWYRLSRHLTRLSPSDAALHSNDCFYFTDPDKAIYHHLPLTVLYLPPFVASLPDPRLEQSPSHVPGHVRRWYETRKQYLYRLSEGDPIQGKARDL